jgi:hypothetical protein
MCGQVGKKISNVVTAFNELIRSVRARKSRFVLASSLNGLGRSVSYLVQVLRSLLDR